MCPLLIAQHQLHAGMATSLSGGEAGSYRSKFSNERVEGEGGTHTLFCFATLYLPFIETPHITLLACLSNNELKG